MYQDYLKYYPDFPIKGVNFVDVLPFMQDKEIFTSIIKDLGKMADSPNVVAPEARGFLFAAPMLTVCDNVKNILTSRSTSSRNTEKTRFSSASPTSPPAFRTGIRSI